MRKSVKRSAVAGAAAAAMLFGGLLTAVPAHAGGPGSEYVEAATKSDCQVQLTAAIGSAIGAGAEVTGVHKCFYTGDHWLGDFVANY